jgi:hypothetical protein
MATEPSFADAPPVVIPCRHCQGLAFFDAPLVRVRHDWQALYYCDPCDRPLLLAWVAGRWR